MKTYEQFIKESSINRIASKGDKGGVGYVSAERADKSKKENKARSKQLVKDIRGAGLPGPTKVEGQYKETGQDKATKEKTSVVSSGKMGKKRFKKTMKKLGKKYDQDSVLIQQSKKKGGNLHGTTKAGERQVKDWGKKVGHMRPGRSGEMQTRVKNKTFTYE